MDHAPKRARSAPLESRSQSPDALATLPHVAAATPFLGPRCRGIVPCSSCQEMRSPKISVRFNAFRSNDQDAACGVHRHGHRFLPPHPAADGVRQWPAAPGNGGPLGGRHGPLRTLARSTMSAERLSTTSPALPLARSCRLIRLRICRCTPSFCHQSTSSVNGANRLVDERRQVAQHFNREGDGVFSPCGQGSPISPPQLVPFSLNPNTVGMLPCESDSPLTKCVKAAAFCLNGFMQ